MKELILHIPEWFILLSAFIWGLVWGSFFNVCIYRIPRKESIIYPPSHCPVCGHRLKWYDNIPLVSYILLKGKCRYCGAKISMRYPIVEFVTGIISILIALKSETVPEFFIYFFFFGCLLVISAIDWDTYTIPDELSLPLLGVGLILLFLHLLKTSPIQGIAGALIGGGIPLLISFVYEKVKKIDYPALGGGDIKILTATGVFLGLYGILFTLIIGSFLGIVIGYPLTIKTGKRVEEEELQEVRYIPFGPFIAGGAFLTYLIGVDKLVHLLLF